MSTGSGSTPDSTTTTEQVTEQDTEQAVGEGKAASAGATKGRAKSTEAKSAKSGANRPAAKKRPAGTASGATGRATPDAADSSPSSTSAGQVTGGRGLRRAGASAGVTVSADADRYGAGARGSTSGRTTSLKKPKPWHTGGVNEATTSVPARMPVALRSRIHGAVHFLLETCTEEQEAQILADDRFAPITSQADFVAMALHRAARDLEDQFNGGKPFRPGRRQRARDDE